MWAPLQRMEEEAYDGRAWKTENYVIIIMDLLLGLLKILISSSPRISCLDVCCFQVLSFQNTFGLPLLFLSPPQDCHQPMPHYWIFVLEIVRKDMQLTLDWHRGEGHWPAVDNPHVFGLSKTLTANSYCWSFGCFADNTDTRLHIFCLLHISYTVFLQ